ncbi:MAG: nucleotidyltransferase domain-containing protein [Candidatus Omnitrophica bacterium]|nr:nucleotidyltransferase domain-containing protein [Candidatus Omnitrophota bacterium]MBU1784995.1 nucleotidyltransferase domain-containing protein [Candidatus Omnitrophota bacterium]MBU1852042.1 nucleotidyltransferase domain-containing protein [Candidatus Omnitrophota bacterium]
MQFNVSLLDFLSSKIQIKIVKFLLTHEASMSEREIASILKVSHMTINRTMQRLADVNFVNFITIGKAHLWKVNRKSYAFKVLSALIDDMSGIKDPFNDLKKVILKNLPRSLIKKAVLFGSIAKGKEKSNSDIDVFILVETPTDKKEIEASIERLSSICLVRYGNRLAPYILTQKEMHQKKHLKIISEITGGVQLFP